MFKDNTYEAAHMECLQRGAYRLNLNAKNIRKVKPISNKLHSELGSTLSSRAVWAKKTYRLKQNKKAGGSEMYTKLNRNLHSLYIDKNMVNFLPSVLISAIGKLCQESIFDDNFTTMINPLHINIMAYNSTPMTFHEVNNTRKFAVEKSENALIYGTRIITYKDKKSFFSKLIYILLQAVVDYQAIVYSVFIFGVSLFLGNPVDQSLLISVLAAILLIPKFILSVRNNDTLHKTHLIMNKDYTFSTLQKRIMTKHGLGAFNLKKNTHLVTQRL